MLYKKPYKYKTQPLAPIIQVESVIDKLHNIYYSVEYIDSDEREKRNVRFKNMSSVIDFISSNF